MCPAGWLAARLADLPRAACLAGLLAHSIVWGRCHGWQLPAWQGADIADCQQSSFAFQSEMITISILKRSNQSIYYFSISIGVLGTGYIGYPCDETMTIFPFLFILVSDVCFTQSY